MIYRVIAGIVPMILGWLLLSGAIPIFRSSTPVPATPVAVGAPPAGAGNSQAERSRSVLSRAASGDVGALLTAQSQIMGEAAELERVMRQAEQEVEKARREEQLQRSGYAGGARQGGWGPSQGWGRQ
jgi:hypothetical protein